VAVSLRSAVIRHGVALAFPFLLATCSNFKVDLSSPEPIKVDVNMRLDVYQYKGDEPGTKDEAEVSYWGVCPDCVAAPATP
jgi:hypothetical protein